VSGSERSGPPAGTAAASVVRWGLVALMAAVAVASIVHVYGRSGHSGSGGSASAAHQAAHETRYRCPMHTQIIRDRPGECPICSMTLVPFEVGSGNDGAGKGRQAPASSSAPAPAGLTPIDLSPERVQLAGIKTAPVVRRRLGGELAAAGVVAENERGLAAITTRFAGWIQDLFVPETGRRVTKGQPLATVYSPDVLGAEQEFLTARRWSATAPPAGSAASPVHAHESLTGGMADDARKRLDLLGVASQEIDEIARTGQAQRAVTVRSPVNGTVLRRGAVAGGYVQPGSELFAIADLSTVWFIAEVYEHDMARVRVGQAARIELTGLPGRAVSGRVQFLYPSVSAETHTMRVRVEVANRGGDLRPGMFGTMHLDLPGEPGLAVPAEAVVDTGDAQYLFVAKAGGRFEPRHVRLGARGAGYVEILDGVTEGEVVVTTANFLIDSESRLRAAIEGAR
jgi:Cu(I)/Ag(I) efflux system membrane fusion protein